MTLDVLPPVHELLNTPEVREETIGIAEIYRTRLVRAVTARFRARLKSQPGAHRDRPAVTKELIKEIVREAQDLMTPFPQRVINGTGVVIHTNLGRAPLGDAWSEIDLRVLSGYSNLEWDVSSQKRSNRDRHAGALLTILTGAEEALVVNNCASALLLALNALAKDKEVLVSRSELVEIGGGFRIPEILETSGCRLVEVGTTNRTRLEDYEARAKSGRSVLLKVHQSNFVQRGFVESVSLQQLVALGRRRKIPVVYDAGSGLLAPSSAPFLRNEPALDQSVKDGAGVVTSSADKLLGSIQAGLIVGKASLLRPMRKNPLYRALRLDKVRLTLLDYALRQYLGGCWERIPLWRMASRGGEDVSRRAQLLRLPQNGGRWAQIQWTRLPGQLGGGSNPEESFESVGLRFLHRDYSAKQLKEKFVDRRTPVLGYIHNNAFHVDVGAFFSDDFDELQRIIDELS